MSLPDNLLNKKVIILLIISIVGSGGIGGHSIYSNAELSEHIEDDSPHIGTEKTLEFIKEYIQEDKDDHKITHDKITELLIKIDRLYFMLCEHNGYICE